MSKLSPKILLFVVLNLFVVILDQATKIWIVQNLRLNRDSISVIDGWLQIVHVQNTGAAGGLLGGFEYRMWVFLVFTVVALGVLISMLLELREDERMMNVSLALIFSGAVGNAIDRAHKQSVTDFIRVYTDNEGLEAWLRSTIGTAEYPSFNVADVAIVVGVFMYMILYAMGHGRPPEEKKKDDEPEAPAPESKSSVEGA